MSATDDHHGDDIFKLLVLLTGGVGCFGHVLK